MNRAIVTSLLVAGLTLGPAGFATAGKGGVKGNGGGGEVTSTSATLYYDCDQPTCYAGDIVYFQGEGYDSAQGQALLQIGAGLYSAVAVASDGTVDFQWNYFQIPGSYSVKLYQNGKGNKLELKSEVTVIME